METHCHAHVSSQGSKRASPPPRTPGQLRTGSPSWVPGTKGATSRLLGTVAIHADTPNRWQLTPPTYVYTSLFIHTTLHILYIHYIYAPQPLCEIDSHVIPIPARPMHMHKYQVKLKAFKELHIMLASTRKNSTHGSSSAHGRAATYW